MSFWENYDKRMSDILTQRRKLIKDQENIKNNKVVVEEEGEEQVEGESQRKKTKIVEVDEDMEVDYDEDIQSNDDIINPKVKLTDCTINRFTESLQGKAFESLGVEYKKRGGKEGEMVSNPKLAVFLSSFLYSTVFKSADKGDFSQVTKFLTPLHQKIDLKSCRCIFFPINISNLHWVCVVYQSGVLYLFDSFITTPLASHPVLDNMEEVMQFLNLPVKQKVIHPLKQGQTDDISCGVYVCHRALCMLNGVLDDELPSPDKFRHVILNTIFS